MGHNHKNLKWVVLVIRKLLFLVYVSSSALEEIIVYHSVNNKFPFISKQRKILVLFTHPCVVSTNFRVIQYMVSPKALS